MIVGPDEENVVKLVNKKYPDLLNRIKFIGYSLKTEDFISSADVLCLPSHREGFGSVIIEAAAIGIPTIGSNIYGISDAVISEKTGILHNVKDSEDIARCIKKLSTNRKFSIELGKSAQQRAYEHFDANKITSYWVKFYKDILNS